MSRRNRHDRPASGEGQQPTPPPEPEVADVSSPPAEPESPAVETVAPESAKPPPEPEVKALDPDEMLLCVANTNIVRNGTRHPAGSELRLPRHEVNRIAPDVTIKD